MAILPYTKLELKIPLFFEENITLHIRILSIKGVKKNLVLQLQMLIKYNPLQTGIDTIKKCDTLSDTIFLKSEKPTKMRFFD